MFIQENDEMTKEHQKNKRNQYIKDLEQKRYSQKKCKNFKNFCTLRLDPYLEGQQITLEDLSKKDETEFKKSLQDIVGYDNCSKDLKKENFIALKRFVYMSSVFEGNAQYDYGALYGKIDKYQLDSKGIVLEKTQLPASALGSSQSQENDFKKWLHENFSLGEVPPMESVRRWNESDKPQTKYHKFIWKKMRRIENTLPSERSTMEKRDMPMQMTPLGAICCV